MTRPLFILLAVWAAALAAAPPVSAQASRPERPYRGLFGSGLEDSEHSLVANGSLGGGFDNNVVAAVLFGDTTRSSNLNTAYKGGVAQAGGSLNYAMNMETVSFNASAGTSLHYVPSIDTSLLRRWSASSGLNVRVTPEITATTTMQYAPYSLASLFPELSRGQLDISTGIPDLDFASSVEHYFSYTVGAGYERQLSRRATLSAGYSYRWRDASPLTRRQFAHHRADGQWRYELGEGLALRAGYGLQYSARTSSGDGTTAHRIDAGLDYNRQLSFSRRTTLSFGSGTAIVSRPDPGDPNARLRLTGNATLAHEIGRTWQAQVSYGRNVRFDENWGDVVSSDGVSAAFGGLLTRRLSFQATARTSLGTIGTGGNRNYRGRYGNASLGYHVGRNVGLALTYAYYRHRFDGGVELPTDYAGAFNRHSVRASINVWAPLLQLSRRR